MSNEETVKIIMEGEKVSTVAEKWINGIYETYRQKYEHVFQTIEDTIVMAMEKGTKKMDGFVLISTEPLKNEEYQNFKKCLETWSKKEGILVNNIYDMAENKNFPRLDWHFEVSFRE